MNDKNTTQYLDFVKVVSKYPINTVVGWYNYEGKQLFGIVKSYTFNSVGETCIEVELVVGAFESKITLSLHPENKAIELFKV